MTIYSTPGSADRFPARAIVVGGGPVGCLAAAMLARHGFEVDVCERRPSFLQHGFGDEGRTINLSVSPRGMRALAKVGCRQDFADAAMPMDRRVVHTRDRQVLITRYEQPGWRNHSIARNELNLLLLRNAQRRPGVRVHFSTACASIDFDRREAVFATSAGEQVRPYHLLVAADGAHSQVRAAMLDSGLLTCQQTTLDARYRELTLRPAEPGRLSRSAIHVWPREGFFLCALPNVDGTFRATLVLPAEGQASFEEIRRTGLRNLVRRHFGDTVPDIDWHTAQSRDAPPARMEQILSSTLHYRNSVVLAGDAAHTMAPFLGQGINAGFEDLITLDNVLARAHPGGLGAALSEYSRERKAQGDAAAMLSMTNYRELTAQTGDGRPPAPVSGLPLPIVINFLGLSYQEVLRQHLTIDGLVPSSIATGS
ncbi:MULTISPECIES: FAD-dependent oxidoreductase [Amycolatopsis]|uniref:NAD(P)/FAD-dependent oxidoreductase n=1 Tax=Amycolatopsis albidoflavus TaxID=102226 RepID=A0ABW5HTR5_9PSEU